MRSRSSCLAHRWQDARWPRISPAGSLPAKASPSSAAWNASHPPRRERECRPDAAPRSEAEGPVFLFEGDKLGTSETPVTYLAYSRRALPEASPARVSSKSIRLPSLVTVAAGSGTAISGIRVSRSSHSSGSSLPEPPIPSASSRFWSLGLRRAASLIRPIRFRRAALEIPREAAMRSVSGLATRQ